MTSPAPLTEAEAAAARALAGDFECSWHVGCDEECRADMARAVVAAVRSQIEADAIDAFADAIDAYGPPSAIHTRGVAFVVRQGRMTVRDWLASDAALSLPASKETPDAR